MSILFSSASFRAILRAKLITYLLGVSATFYLGFNLVLGGGLAEIPIVVLSLIALVFFRPSEAVKHESTISRKIWAFALLGFALWSCFIIWFHEGEIELYEPYAKLLVGSLVAFAMLYHRINVAYIRAGLYVAAISLIYLYFFEYNGKFRFSNGMNPNKWSPLLLSYAVATFVMIISEKTKVLKMLALVSWIVFAFMIFLAASRATTLILLIVTVFPLIFLAIRNRALIFVFASLFAVFAGFKILTINNLFLETRFNQFFNEFKSYENDRLETSSGIRYIMWKSGLYGAKDNLFLGSGFDLAKSLENYDPESKGESKVLIVVKKQYGSFHNIWVDALVSQGVVGFAVLLSFFIVTLSLIRKNGRLLVLGPLIAVGLNGFTESTLYMSILAGHLALAGAIFMNVEDGMHS